jgi:hypothetical protein
MTGREYREYFELEVKRGVVPEWYRKLKGDQAIDNETYKNLEKGARFRFKKGQKGIGTYKRSPITMERLKNQGNRIGKEFGGQLKKDVGIDSDIGTGVK